MSVTLIMTWDIKDDVQEDYFEFVIREWVPATTQLGLQTVAAWYTQYRIDESIPNIRAEAIAEDETAIRRILKSTEWQDIQADLMDYVENYNHKIVETTGEFRL